MDYAARAGVSAARSATSPSQWRGYGVAAHGRFGLTHRGGETATTRSRQRYHLVMRLALTVFVLSSALLTHFACGTSNGGNAPPGGFVVTPPDANVIVDGASDASDPRCATQATLLGTHAHAAAQPTPLGKTLLDTRGWNGLLYFAYGDFEANTGPIAITTFDPKKNEWVDHPVAYDESGTGALKSTPKFWTHAIERFFLVGDELWATAAQPLAAAPFDGVSAPELARGKKDHTWTQIDIAPRTLHVVSAVERAPGDIYVTGSALNTVDGGFADGRPGGHVWRSVDGGPFTQLFPDFPASTGGAEFFDLSGAWIVSAALNGVMYMSEAGYIYKHDGTTWSSWEEFGQFLAPATFAGHLVWNDLGQLYAFDGAKRKNLDFRFFESQGRYQTKKEPLALFQVTEGRLLAVKQGGDVMMTTDLVSWRCIGKAPPDASSIGSLDGVIYFGSVNSTVYGFPSRSW